MQPAFSSSAEGVTPGSSAEERESSDEETGDQNLGRELQCEEQKKQAREPLGDDVILLFTDAFDVLVGATAQRIIQVYKSFRSPIVFSAERVCWPDADAAGKYENVQGQASKYSFPYLNSG